MNNNKPHGSNSYREQQILTASPARLVAMLYEKAITSLRLAIKAIEDGDIQARWKANARAVEIIEHLSMTLDTDKGGEIARSSAVGEGRDGSSIGQAEPGGIDIHDNGCLAR